MGNLDQRISQLYRAALDLPVEKRSAFLEQACAGDASLRQVVESLLARSLDEPAAASMNGATDGTTLQSPPPSRPPPVALSADQLLADRFRILRFVDHGGMGEVYEAYDLELHERVALKTIRPEIAEDERVMARFRREVHLARKVTHPNVCRLYDIFHHRIAPNAPGQRAERITFLTMELLPGRTLAETLQRRPMTTSAALPLVAQMVEALAAAHKVAVVHRDFKSTNVILVPTTEDEASRVVVTDFGLAHSTDTDPSFARSISGGDIVGTPAFMAPEQVQGREVTPATDIYALGVVMYQMVTGALPFPGETPLSQAIGRLQDTPQTPRAHVPDLDPNWESVIMRCLARRPDDRFVSVRDVVTALRGESVAQSPSLKSSAGRNKMLVVGAVVAATLIFSAGGYFLYHFLYHRLSGSRSSPSSIGMPAAISSARPAVAVLGFKNLSGREEASWLAPALAEMLTTELAAGEQLRAIPGENVARMNIELTLSNAESYALDTIEKIRANLGADLIVFGSYLSQGHESGGRIRLDLRVQNAASGEMIARVAETGTEAEFLELVSRTGARVRERLGVTELASAEVRGVRTSLPSNPDAARFYTQGLSKLRLSEFRAARELLEKAVGADPTFPLAHAALAEAWKELGYLPRAKAAAEKAFALSERLSREDRLSVEARYREIEGTWDQSIELYRTLFNFFPDNLEHGLSLAEAQASGGKGQDALLTVEVLRQLPPPARDDVRIDLAECSAAVSLADFKRLRDAATRAVVKGDQLGARLLVARAHLEASWAFQNLGELATARAAVEESKRIFDAAGDRNGAMNAMNQLALILEMQGETERPKQIYEDLLALGREIGNPEAVATALNNLSITLSDEDDLEGARRMLEEAIPIDRELGNKRATAIDIYNLAILVHDLGDRPGAKTKFEESLAIYREIGNKRGEGKTLLELARLLADEGDLAEAGRRCDEALENLRGIGQESDAAEALLRRGELLLTKGDLAGARQSYEGALAIKSRLGDDDFVGLLQKALAELLIEEGRPEEAQALCEAAVDVLRKKKWRSHEALAQEVLARSYLARGNLTKAQLEIDRATSLASQSPLPRVRLTVAITAARVLAQRGEFRAAIDNLESVFEEATKLDSTSLMLEARLALGEAELRSGRLAAGRARLDALETDARAMKFALIAEKSRAAVLSVLR